MCDCNVRDALLGELFDAARHGRVEADTRMPQDDGSAILGPLSNLVAVARDEDRQFAGGGDNTIGGPASKRLALIGSEYRREPRLSVGE